MSAETVNDILGYVSAGAFGLLGLAALGLWWRRRDRPSLWAALCFGSLGSVALVGQFLPEDAHSDFEVVAQRILVVVLILFPYLLFKFTTAFDPASRRLEWSAAAITALLVAWAIALPHFAQTGEDRSPGFTAFLYALLAQFAVLSVLAAYRLWRAGREQSSVARNRMRMLSLAAVWLTATLFFAVVVPPEQHGLQIAVSALGIASALIFLLGFVPPEIVRIMWRRPEQDRAREAIGGLVTATTPDEIARNVLPSMTRLVGAQGVFLLDGDGEIIASHGAKPPAHGGDLLHEPVDPQGARFQLVVPLKPATGPDQ